MDRKIVSTLLVTYLLAWKNRPSIKSPHSLMWWFDRLVLPVNLILYGSSDLLYLFTKKSLNLLSKVAWMLPLLFPIELGTIYVDPNMDSTVRAKKNIEIKYLFILILILSLERMYLQLIWNVDWNFKSMCSQNDVRICDKGFVNFSKSNFNLWRLLMMIVNFMGLWKGFDSKLLNFYD